MKLLVATLLAVVAMASGNVLKPQGTFELLILHNNDMHAHFEQSSQRSGTCTNDDREAGKCYGGFPRVAHVVKQAREAALNKSGPPVLYLNAGDTYTGTAWFTIYKWKIAAEFVNALQPDAVSLGNHEFDNGVSGLTPFIENLKCPVLCANLNLKKVPDLAREPNLKKSIILDVAGHKVGVVGYLTPDTKVLAKPNDVEYFEEIEALNTEVKKLQAQGIKIIFAVGHSGYEKDKMIAEAIDGIDVVIGGHTNTFLWNGTSPDSERAAGYYPTYVKQASGRTVLVVQAYAYTKYLGKLHLVFDSNGEIITADGAPILLDKSIPQDKDVLQIVNKYRESILNITETVLGHTSVILDNDRCHQDECNLGNMIADAMVYRYASDHTGEHWTDAPIAVLGGCGIRSTIAHAKMPMNITKGDLLEVMPFEGDLVAVTLNGSVLLQALEHSVAGINNVMGLGGFLQYSGIKVTYNLNKPVGSRVVQAEARCWACDVPRFSKIQEKDIYKVLMPGFLANGGDGFAMFLGLPRDILNYNELQCTEYYVSRQNIVYPQIEGRITFVHENGNSSSSIAKISFLTIIIAFVSLLLL
ncbi:protein 5NUC-like isoform X2 [Helicoverpa zea]|uniref:protein 5NUC-like isoform X2 n=1 Tax=Helicoverpa zea TaxID=7113 RepID=UPI001F593B22|nr:protein 5NUC-like isoform X2 [Helicoverpa zea]